MGIFMPMSILALQKKKKKKKKKPNEIKFIIFMSLRSLLMFHLPQYISKSMSYYTLLGKDPALGKDHG